MTKKEFKAALERGLGRCILAVKEDREKYRDIVLWACTHDTAFDPQCEGTRAWYIYQMVCEYEDWESFVNAAEKKLLRPGTQGWLVTQLSEFLAYFAQDGWFPALTALKTKFSALWFQLSKLEGFPDGVFCLWEDFEALCVNLSYDRKNYLWVTEQVGRLYQCRPFYRERSLSWLFANCGEKYNASLKKAAKTSPEIACYLETELAAWEREQALKKRDYSQRPAQEADRQTLLEYVENYVREQDPKRRAQALLVFARCPYPGDPAPVIADTKSEYIGLRIGAQRILERTPHPAVRAYALENLRAGVEIGDSLSLLRVNYQPEDWPLVEQSLAALPLDPNKDSDWHSAQMDILRLFDQESKIPCPKELLPLIYETTHCSNCREHALTLMGRHRLTTQEILLECQYDCNDDIRKYARRILKKKAKT